jgi:hypothetical protein
MNNPRHFPGRGFSFVEILMAVVAVTVMGVPIMWLLSSSRVETSRAINYLRALEIGYETIEWIQTLSVHSPDFGTFPQSESRSLSGGSLGEMVAYDVGQNPKWQAMMAKTISYPEQYYPPYFYREIQIEDAVSLQEKNANNTHASFLKRVVVTVSWNEGKVPVKIDRPERMRKIVLATLILDDSRGY